MTDQISPTHIRRMTRPSTNYISWASRVTTPCQLVASLLLLLACESPSEEEANTNAKGAGGSANPAGGSTAATGGEDGVESSGGGSSSVGGASDDIKGSGGSTNSGGSLGDGGISGVGGDVGDGGASLGGSASEAGGSTGSGGAPIEIGFFGASRCETADLLLCDGFEGTTLDNDLWNMSKSGDNTLEITSEQAARGDQSIHIIANNGHAFISNESLFPMENNDYFGRMFLRIKRFSTVDWAHWTVAEGAGTGNSSKIRVGGQYIRTDFDTDTWANRWGVGSDGGETGDWTRADQDPVDDIQEPAVEQWNCVEWQHQGSTNETRFFLDGVEHASLHTTAQDHGGESGEYTLPQMTSIWFGWTQYQQDDQPFEVWIDEVALDDERIGCSL